MRPVIGDDGREYASREEEDRVMRLEGQAESMAGLLRKMMADYQVPFAWREQIIVILDQVDGHACN